MYLLCVSVLCLVFIFFVVQCDKDKGTSPWDQTQTKWTILVYSAGNNNLDKSLNNTSYVIENVHGLEKIGSTDEVQVVVMLASFKTGGVGKYYHIEKHTSEMLDSVSSSVLEDLGTKDMSDPTTLKDFVQYGVENYPADHYMLIIDDHGGGWRGACLDEQNGAGDMMTLPEVKSALSWDSAPKFDLIVFHASLMSMVEVAYELKGCADYLVACQLTMPMENLLGSEEWLGGLVANPNMSALDLGKSIVTAVYNAGQKKDKLTHFALTDLSKVNDLSARIATLGKHLITETGDYWNEVSHAWGETHYTQYDDAAFVDIGEFVKKVLQEEHLKNIPLISSDAQAVIDGVNEAVPYAKTNIAGFTRGGLCIHFPFTKADFDSANYVKIAFRTTNWHNFLSEFIQKIGGGPAQQAQISGTVTWPGHTLSANTYAWLDSSHSKFINIAFLALTYVDPATGNYTITIDLQAPMEVFIEAADDLDGDRTVLEPDEAFGWYDPNGNQLWEWEDMIILSPGQQLSGINITLLDL